MEIFRNLSGNIFFKMILGLVALSFVFFGVSGFILGNPNSWVVKVGGDSVGLSSFNNALRADRDIVLSTTKSPEALKYVESEKFKKDVMGRMVNKLMVEKLKDDFGVAASRSIIFKAIAKDPSFRNDSGKFDRAKFQRFLANNGFNEERYVNEISNEVSSVMILQSMSLVAPTNNNNVIAREKFKQEKRLADVITVSEASINTKKIKASKAEIEEFFAQNKHQYLVPEMREVLYLHFSKKNFAQDFKISDQDVFAEYENNKDTMKEPEGRNFYQLVFDTKEEAESFAASLNKKIAGDKSKIKATFARLAKDLKKKDLKAISVDNIYQRGMIEGLAKPTFDLKLNELSTPLESPIGFHLFVLTKITKSQTIPFSEVKKQIREKMTRGREERVLQDKMSEIDEMLLTSNSLSEVTKKFKIKANKPVVISGSGDDSKGKKIEKLAKFQDFTVNAFALKQGQISKIFYSKNTDGFYVLKLNKIIPKRERKLSEVKSKVEKNLLQKKTAKAIKKLADTISAEVATNPSIIAKIAAKHRVAFKKNSEFARNVYFDFQGRKVPFQSEFLKKLFSLELNQPTDTILNGEDEFLVAVLRKIKQGKVSGEELQQAQEQAAKSLSDEIMSDYNSYLLRLYPVEVNQKFFAPQQ
jgi:peptidyl-prolyl cis-trans isomerase D